MAFTPEQIIMVVAATITLLLLIFAVDWRHFRDWVVLFLFKCTFDLILGSAVVERDLVDYPVRLLPHLFDTSIIFELWVFPVLCILYNQVTRTRGLVAIIGYALLFSAGIVAVEYPLERYTRLIRYIDWTAFTSFYTIAITFLVSRAFMAFYRWGCTHFGGQGCR